jgi:hypothetical protein
MRYFPMVLPTKSLLMLHLFRVEVGDCPPFVLSARVLPAHYIKGARERQWALSL